MNNYNYMYYDLNHNMNREMINNKDSLLNPKEGFIKGNMFGNLYQGYKKYQPKMLIPKNEKEKMLYELYAISFAVHELNLYLDTHPDNQSIFMLFKDYVTEKEKMTKVYEGKYGPLTVCSIDNNINKFNWVDDSWPWEVKNV